MRLGKLEKAILVAIHKHGRERKHEEDPQLYRDELPHLLFGWEKHRSFRRCYVRKGEDFEYRNIPSKEYSTKQAALTRALQTLYQKGLIDCGDSYGATGLKVYSERRAKAL